MTRIPIADEHSFRSARVIGPAHHLSRRDFRFFPSCGSRSRAVFCPA